MKVEKRTPMRGRVTVLYISWASVEILRPQTARAQDDKIGVSRFDRA